MSGLNSMLGSFWTNITDFITGIFALIPQYLYFFYTCIASILDLFQFVLRKLAGLDSYYVNGVATEGDLLSQFINGILGLNGSYSALNTVFWALVIFGAIVLVVGLIMSLIKAHYNYDSKKSRPTAILGKGLKAIATFAIVPLVTVFGVYLSNILLQALDSITASSSSGNTASVYANSSADYKQVFKSDKDEWGNETYISYDFFGSHAPTGHQSFSGLLFQAAAYNANRVRYGGFTASLAGEAWSDCGIFNSSLSSEQGQTEDVANMIDYAFMNNLTLNTAQTASVLKSESSVLMSSFRYWQSAIWYAGTINFNNFSKYNVGLVWYYYNLWSFNFIIGFLGVIICVTLLFNIVFGLVVRLIEATALFLCVGPIVSIMPLDDGRAFKSWRKNFVGDVLMAYGAIVGINLLFMILPYLQAITFFDSVVLNAIMNMVFVIVGLLAAKQIVTMLSNFVGGKSAYSEGEKVKKEAGKVNPFTIKNAATAVALGAKVAKFVPGASAVAMKVEKAAQKIRQNEVNKAQNKKAQEGQAKVSQATHEAIRQQQIDELEQQKEQFKDMEDEQRKLSASETKKAVDAESSANDNDNISEEDTKKFEAWLRAGASDTFDAENDTDKDLAEQIKKEYESINEFNETPETDADAEGYGSSVSDEELAKLREKHLQEAVEKYRNGNSHARQAQTNRQNAEQYRNNAKDADSQAEDYKKQIEELQKQIETTKSTDVLDGYTIKKSPLPKNTISQFVKFSGDTIKAAGTELGFEEFIAKINKETGLVDQGKLIMRDFAQTIGVQASSIAGFQTSKEKADAKKAKLSEKLTVNSGVSESLEKLKAVQELENEWKKYKNNKKS